MLKKSQFAKLPPPNFPTIRNLVCDFYKRNRSSSHEIEKYYCCCVYPWNIVSSVTWTKEYKQSYGGNVSILFIFYVIHMSHVVYVMWSFHYNCCMELLKVCWGTWKKWHRRWVVSWTGRTNKLTSWIRRQKYMIST